MKQVKWLLKLMYIVLGLIMLYSREGVKCQIPFLEPTQRDPFASKLYDVSIVEQSMSYDSAWNGSPWMSLKVKFSSDGSLDWFSPWDVVSSQQVQCGATMPIHVSHKIEGAFRDHIDKLKFAIWLYTALLSKTRSTLVYQVSECQYPCL